MVTAGAAVAALLGAGAWALIAAATGYELGLVAWAIGGLSGFGAVMFANGHADGRIQLIAVVASLGGILMGKYLSFLSLYNDMAAQLSGEDLAFLEDLADDPGVGLQLTELSFSTGFPTFMEWGMMLGLFDVLWIFLAVSTAWKIAAQRG